MKRFRGILTAAVLLVGDVTAVAASYVLAYVVRNSVLHEMLHLLPEALPFTHLAERSYLLAVYLLVFSYEGLYTKRLAGWEEARRYFRGLIVATAAVMIILFGVRYLTLSRTVVLLAFIIGSAVVPIVRILLKRLLVRLGLSRRPLVLLGGGAAAELFARELVRHRSLGYVVSEHIQRGAGEEPVEGMLDRLPEVAGKTSLVVFSDSFDSGETERILRHAERRYSEVLVVPNAAVLQSQAVDIEQVGSVLVMKYRHNLLRPLSTLLKRALELLACVLLLVLLSPLLGLLALLVKLSSPGPVFFRQDRIGRSRRLFACLKFRTMRVDAEQRLQELLEHDAGIRAEWQKYARITNDPRITGVGRMLRRFSLDELPQLWNVIRGEMALVGPRPYLPRESGQIGDYLDAIVRVRPGMTGLWQVSGRSALPFAERLVLDEFYIRNWSLWMDFSIVLRTVWVVLGGHGAY